MELQIRLLGQFSVTVDGRPLASLAGGRLQSLFTYLVLRGGAPQSRSDLAQLFWPDTDESNARNNLRQLIHKLREALGEAAQFVRITSSTLQWDRHESCAVDALSIDELFSEAQHAKKSESVAHQLSVLERAFELCGGPLAPSCYDDWITPERERLVARCKSATQEYLEIVEATREYKLAIPHVNHRLRHDPADEEAYQCLMRLHALCNDRAAALHVFKDCRDALKRELDAEPSESTILLHDSIKAEGRQFIDARRPHADGPSLPLIGRVDEWRALRTAWDVAAAGTAHFVLVKGEAGIGKSRLAAELLSWAARQGLATAKTRSYAAEGQLALAPVTDWLRSEAIRPSLDRLDDVWFSEVSRIVPELRSEGRGLQPAGMGERPRLFEAVARAILAAPQPLLLVIDDLQWCDPETLHWLHYLLRFEPSASLLVVGTVRSEELPGAQLVQDLQLRLEEQSAVTEIVLEPLDGAETAALAAQIANRDFDAETTTRLYRETEGNPLFVVEMLRGNGARILADDVQRSGLPSRVHAVIAGRLAQLSPAATDVVSAVAIVARACKVSILARALNCTEHELVPALAELWQKRILREEEANAYHFTHDKLREVAYDQISPPQRRSLHQIIACAIEAVEHADLDRASGQIAAHFDRAGLVEQAIPYYIRAANAAQIMYANGEAQAQIERGLALVSTLPESSKRDRWELELQLVLAPVLRVTKGWATPELEAVLVHALALSEMVGTPTQRAQVLYGLQSLYMVQGKHERAQMYTHEIADLLGHTPGGEQPLSAVAMITGVKLALGRFQEAIDEWEGLLQRLDPAQLRDLQDSQGLNYRVISCAWESHALWCVGRPRKAMERCMEAVQLASDLAQPFNRALAATYLALLQQLCADAGTFREQAEEALRLSTEFEAPYYRAWASILVAYARACERPQADTLAEVEEAIERFTGTGARLRLPYYRALLSDVCLRAHEPERGLRTIEEGLAAGRDGNERWWDAELHRLRGDLLVARGDVAEEAELAYRRALEIATAQGAKSLELRIAISRARLWEGSSRSAEARSFLGRTLEAFSEGFDTRDHGLARALLNGS